MITVVCWKWTQPGYRSIFQPYHVHTLRNMIRRNLQLPHRFVCITDDATGINPQLVETMELWREPNIVLPQGKPNCYRRLRVFAEDARDWLGERILSIDLDAVITGDITPLVDVNDDFKIWGDTARNTAYNGGFWLLRAGTRTSVWDKFTNRAPRLTRSRGMVGSDQAWLSYCLGPRESRWTTDDGVYSFRNHMGSGTEPLPKDARVVFFHGKHDPWDPKIQEKSPWIKKYYR